ncbi:hypothetical protein JOB18_009060 [Solea senegalensis]|uniref:Uncharacterized protein n=1 Tax=Solea senegalensis TaxID=28829 RepID=A0AAV6R403_SOLSE|nr:hypothetical protein JOB18_009060 [Solea senegalensis]
MNTTIVTVGGAAVCSDCTPALIRSENTCAKEPGQDILCLKTQTLILDAAGDLSSPCTLKTDPETNTVQYMNM